MFLIRAQNNNQLQSVTIDNLQICTTDCYTNNFAYKRLRDYSLAKNVLLGIMFKQKNFIYIQSLLLIYVTLPFIRNTKEDRVGRVEFLSKCKIFTW